MNENKFFVKGRPGLVKSRNDYDVIAPETNRPVMFCREENQGPLTRLLRFTSLKRTTPFDIRVLTPEGRPILRMRRGVPVLASKVRVFDENDRPIGGFKQRPFSISGAYDVLDAQDGKVCELKAGFGGLNFRFIADDGAELAVVTRKWAGLGKELLTSADDYMLSIDEAVPKDSLIRRLILASVLCIDLVQKLHVP